MSSALWLAIWVFPVQWRRSDTAGVTLVTIRSCNTILSWAGTALVKRGVIKKRRGIWSLVS